MPSICVTISQQPPWHDSNKLLNVSFTNSWTHLWYSSHQKYTFHSQTLPEYLPRIPESEVQSDGRSEVTSAWGIDARKLLALIDLSDQFIELHMTHSHHPRLPQILASDLNMLTVRSLSESIYHSLTDPMTLVWSPPRIVIFCSSLGPIIFWHILFNGVKSTHHLQDMFNSDQGQQEYIIGPFPSPIICSSLCRISSIYFGTFSLTFHCFLSLSKQISVLSNLSSTLTTTIKD